MLYSPNGEPLNGRPLGSPACKDAMSAWFTRVDLNHDGTISLAEFLADADQQFARMDIDHNGYLVSEELERFRKPYRQQDSELAAVDSGSNGGQAGLPDSQQDKRKRKRGGDENAAAEVPPADTPDPVMSADLNTDFKVTPQEFQQHARDVFAEMNASHTGALTLDEAIARCPKAP